MSTCTMPADTKSRTATAYAVLGLLSVRSWTTYELAKQVRRSLNWFWPRAERKLYDEPKALVAAGLATARKQYTGKRPRTVYEITDGGREALRVWLDEPPAPPATEFEAVLKVFFADAGSVDQLSRTLDAVEATAAGRLRELAGMTEQGLARSTGFPQRLHISALALRLQYEEEAAVLSWSRWAHDQVGRWRSTSDPGDWPTAEVFADILADVSRLLDQPPG
jgi:PadR family transcriptional regulator, regulatory protein AphA